MGIGELRLIYPTVTRWVTLRLLLIYPTVTKRVTLQLIIRTEEKTKELNKRECPLPYFDYLKKNHSNEVSKIKAKYNLPENEWVLCIGKFNEKKGSSINIASFERFVNNWKNNLKLSKNNPELKPSHLRESF